MRFERLMRNIARLPRRIKEISVQAKAMPGRVEKIAISTNLLIEQAKISRHARPLITDIPYTLHNIELTNHCPMSCLMCPRTKQMKRSLGFMDMKLYKSLIDQFQADNPTAFNTGTQWNGTCLHHFGESLLHPEFDEAVRYAQNKGLNICISLNPMVLTPDKAERLFKARPAMIFICVDGYDNASFEKIRGVANAYEKSVANTLMAIEHRNRFSPDTDLRVTIIDIPVFYNEITKVCEEWDVKFGVKIQRKKFSRWNTSDPDINALGNASPEIRAETCELPLPVVAACDTPWRYMSVNWDGAVVPCCRDHSKLFILGDANSDSLAKIWNGKPMQSLRQEIRSGFVFNTLCEVCEYTIHEKEKA